MKCDVASVLEANNQCSERIKHGDVFKLFPRKKEWKAPCKDKNINII